MTILTACSGNQIKINEHISEVVSFRRINYVVKNTIFINSPLELVDIVRQTETTPGLEIFYLNHYVIKDSGYIGRWPAILLKHIDGPFKSRRVEATSLKYPITAKIMAKH